MYDVSVLESWIKRRMARDGAPGLVVGVTDRTDTLYIGTFGFADLAAATPVGEHHAFEIGSIGKSFTAMVLLQLQERGQIDLHAPVSRYLPWFEAGPHSSSIAVHHLMCHTSGIVSGHDGTAEGRYEAWSLRDQPVLGAPGEHFNYSNVGYKMLGYIIEEITGEPYGKVVARELFAPLGMTESFTPITDREWSRLAVGYRPQYRDRPARVEHGHAPAAWIETGTGDGSIAGTIGDMLAYTRLLLHEGEGIISRESFVAMTENYAPRTSPERESTYGYGLMTWEVEGRRKLGHGGGMIGFFSALEIDPEAGLGAFAMVNGGSGESEIASQALNVIRASIAGEPPREMPVVEPAWTIAEAADLAGDYQNDEELWRLVADGARLWLDRPYGRAAIERSSRSSFVILDPTLDRTSLGFERDEEGSVVALNHGERWMARAGSTHPAVGPIPDRWRAYLGDYQNYNPWLQRFSVFERRGSLWCSAGGGRKMSMTELAPGVFQVGETPSAERLGFDTEVDGQALRADWGGQHYFRTSASSVRPKRT